MALQPQDVEAARIKILQALATLPEEHRELIRKVLFQGVSSGDACLQLGIPYSAASTKLERAFQYLNEAVKDDPAVRSYTDELLAKAHHGAAPNGGIAQKPKEASLTPELQKWARQQFNEEEIAAGIREIRANGGLEFQDFVDELEKAADVSE
jgi:hypothetical protein